MDENSNVTEMTADIVAAYVTKNKVGAADIPALIQTVHQALASVGDPAPQAAAEPQKPYVSVKKSITPDYLISLEDGKPYKSLKRHLRTKYDMTPEQYRAKWNLPKDYPMVAPNYAASRSALAKSMGLGRVAKSAPAAKPGRKPRAKKETTSDSAS